ncbi:type IV pilus modification PilV family protein [Thiomonas sp.]
MTVTSRLNPRSPATPVGQVGLSLISVLVAIVIFSLGMLTIASMYTLAVPAVTANAEAMDTAAFGNQFWSALQSNPGIVNTLFGTQPAAGAKVTYTAATYTSAPPALQPMLTNLFAPSQMNLPNASVTITAQNGADGNPCSAPASPAQPICGISLLINWTPSSGSQRSQSFDYQVGF